MKHLDYCYYNIYNFLSRTRQYGQLFHTRIMAMYLFSIGACGWFLLGQSLYLHLIKHSWFESRGESTLFAVSLYALMSVVIHYVFIKKGRDQKIFAKYEKEGSHNPKMKLHLIISASVLALPYLALTYFSIHLNQ